MKKNRKLIIYFIVVTILFAVMGWFASVPINPFLSDSILYFTAYLFFVALGILGSEGISSFTSVLQGGHFYYNKKKLIVSVCLVGIPILYLIIMNILGLPIFNTDAYKNQIGKIEVKEFTDDIQPLDVSQLPVVDLDLASKLADKKLGEKPALGSQVHLGEPTIQTVNGKLVWVVPLQHSGFFKWITNLEGTPGYIVVSATDPKDVSYVDNYKIKYQPDSYFAQNLTRHVRFGKGLTNGLTDYSFELDDSGKPYWVVTTYKNSRFMALPEATGVIIVDAQTGEQQEYNLNEIPEWVDRVQPRSFMMQQINNRGNYIHGVFNFSNKDKFKTSDLSNVVYNNGECYLFTGITSIASDEATTGFMMVNLKTKHVIQYNIGGATEEAAQRSAEGKVQNLGYEASYPIMTNVNGTPTYFMTLKDKSGLIKQYAFVSVKDYTSVGNGETAESALLNYQQLIQGSSDAVIEDQTNVKVQEGTIERIAPEVQGQTTIYKIILKEIPDKIFTASSNLSDELALSEVSDKVSIRYYETQEPVINAIAFDNLQFTQK